MGGVNLYAYVGNNPLSYIDPLGLCLGGSCHGQDFLDWYNPDPYKSTPTKPVKPNRTPAEEEQAQAEHDWYKSQCGLKPPPSGDKCQDLLNEANRAYMCADLMGQWDERWGPGRHASDIEREFQRFRRLMEEYEKCKKQCK